jgi:hypothetical protein
MAPLVHRDVADLIRAIQEDADGFERAFAQVATPEALWRLIIDMSSERDRSFYLGAGFTDAYQRRLQEGFAHGVEGYVRDLVNAVGPWPVEPERIDVAQIARRLKTGASMTPAHSWDRRSGRSS